MNFGRQINKKVYKTKNRIEYMERKLKWSSVLPGCAISGLESDTVSSQLGLKEKYAVF